MFAYIPARIGSKRIRKKKKKTAFTVKNMKK